MRKHSLLQDRKSNRQDRKEVSAVLSHDQRGLSCESTFYETDSTPITIGSAIGLSPRFSTSRPQNQPIGELEQVKMDVRILQTEVEHLYELVHKLGGK